MAGLILKDTYSTLKQAKSLLLMVILFAIVPGNMFGFAMFVGTMMPITALAFDERAGWNKLAAMMPYSSRDMVLSKYIEGYIYIGGTTILVLVSRFLYSLFVPSAQFRVDLLFVLLFACASLCVGALGLPFMYKFGTEKGRYAWTFINVACIVMSNAWMMSAREGSSDMVAIDFSYNYLLLGMVVFTILFNIISILLSDKLYRTKHY